MYQSDAFGITTALITIGASSCVGMTAGPYANSWMINLQTGGTVSLVGQSTLAKGYLLATVPVMIGGPATFWVNETAGVTSVISIAKTLTSGFA